MKSSVLVALLLGLPFAVRADIPWGKRADWTEETASELSTRRETVSRRRKVLADAALTEGWPLLREAVRTRDLKALATARSELGGEVESALRASDSEEKWRQLSIMRRAFYLHKAGMLQSPLRENVLLLAQARERSDLLGKGSGSMDSSHVSRVAGACYASLIFSRLELPNAHRTFEESFAGWVKGDADPDNGSQCGAMSVNLVIEMAYASGRIRQLDNWKWRMLFDRFRDTLCSSGAMPQYGAIGWNPEYGSWANVLHAGARVFNDPTCLYAALKHEAWGMQHFGSDNYRFTPQWFLHDDSVAALTPEPPDVLSTVVRSRASGEPPVILVLKTGHSPRDSSLMLNWGGGENGFPSLAAAVQCYIVGGVSLTERQGDGYGPGCASAFAVVPQGAPFPLTAGQAGTQYKAYTSREALPIGIVPGSVIARNQGADAYGCVSFSPYVAKGVTLTRQLVLTPEGVLVIRDDVSTERGSNALTCGAVWTGATPKTKTGGNWCGYAALGSQMPSFAADEQSGPLGALVRFSSSIGRQFGTEDRTAFVSESLNPGGSSRFITVVVPHPPQVSSESVATGVMFLDESEGVGVRVRRGEHIMQVLIGNGTFVVRDGTLMSQLRTRHIPRRVAASTVSVPVALPRSKPVALPVSRVPRKVSPARVSAVDTGLFSKLARLDLTGDLPGESFAMGDSKREVRLVGVRGQSVVFSARVRGKEQEVIAPISKLAAADRASIVLALTRSDPDNRSLCGLAAFYLELAGQTSEADKYFGLAGTAARAPFEKLFDE